MPLSIIDPTASVPRLFLYVHLPTMLIILVLFRIYIVSAVRKGHFNRWFGVPLVTIYVAYIVALLTLSVDRNIH